MIDVMVPILGAIGGTHTFFTSDNTMGIMIIALNTLVLVKALGERYIAGYGASMLVTR